MSEEQARYPKLGKILNLLIKMQSRYSGRIRGLKAFGGTVERCFIMGNSKYS